MGKTKVLLIDPENVKEKLINIAGKALSGDKVVAFPTATVYGLGCNVQSESALKRIFALKKRHFSHQVASCLKAVDDLDDYSPQINQTAQKIIENFLPGPVTILLRCEGARVLGFRIPDYEITQRLIALAGGAIYATSANISGGKDITTAEEVLTAFDGLIDVLVDCGPTRTGIPSTVIDLTELKPALIREGSVSAAQIEEIINMELRK